MLPAPALIAVCWPIYPQCDDAFTGGYGDRSYCLLRLELLISRLTFYERGVAYYVLREGFRHVARNTQHATRSTQHVTLKI